MKITVFGLGYVGMTAAACLSSQGHRVIGIDPNAEKVQLVLSGKSPITEPGLDELVSRGIANQSLTAQQTASEECADSDLAIVCVGTPSAPDGSHDMSFVKKVTAELAELFARSPGRTTVAYRSTVRPGTMDELVLPIFRDVLGESIDARVEVVYNPEFLRESSAIDDFFAPPKIVVGTRDGEPSTTMEKLHRGIEAPTFVVPYRESEITKFVDNSFHALKTAFANEVGRVCGALGISAAEVHKIFVADTKLNISPYYLRPGAPFGGSCLPKDVRALQYLGRSTHTDLEVLNSLLRSNESHKDYIYRLVTRDLQFGGSVLMLGLAFKSGSDDLRESPNLDLARMLLTAGYDLAIFDPHVVVEQLMGKNLGVLTDSPALQKLLVNEETVSTRTWDLVIDTRSVASEYEVKAGSVIDINRLA